MRIFLSFFFSLLVVSGFSQEKETEIPKKASYFDAGYFYGNVIRHHKDISHLIKAHPEGLLLSWNQRSDGKKDWQQAYGYPDAGFSFIYQDFKNPDLGTFYGAYAHFNFYLFNSRLKNNQFIFKIGSGFGYVSNPYDKETNNGNVAFGSHLNLSSYLSLKYQNENIVDRFGLYTGLLITHISNASHKAPNRGLNGMAINFGVNYNLDKKDPAVFENKELPKIKEPIKYNIVLTGGFNESDHIDTGIFPFFILSAYADKRLHRKSAIQFGADLHVHFYLKEDAKFKHAFQGNPPETFTPSDFKRIGLFIGHELFVSNLSLVTQLGYYVYDPVGADASYTNIGIKRYFNSHWFAFVNLKVHEFNAESLGLGAGYRF